MALEILNKEVVHGLVEQIDQIIADDFVAGFFWGYCEAKKKTDTIAEITEKFSFLDKEQKYSIIDLLNPYYDKNYNVEESLLNST